MVNALFRVVIDGGTIEVFDARVVITERRIGASVAEEVAKLAELHARGALSPEEFADAKRRVLGPAS